ncbi:hypothetical protein Mapa_008760 [Marchantia paleacea]|nr:hypothetical protein Mapa_008760 [Marchantia paleacea]
MWGEGLTLLDALRRAGVDTGCPCPVHERGVEVCMGNCAVLVATEYLDLCPCRTEEETEVIRLRLQTGAAAPPAVDKHIRLSCALPLGPQHEGMIVLMYCAGLSIVVRPRSQITWDIIIYMSTTSIDIKLESCKDKAQSVKNLSTLDSAISNLPAYVATELEVTEVNITQSFEHDVRLESEWICGSIHLDLKFSPSLVSR